MAGVFLESLSSAVWFQLEKQDFLTHDLLINELRSNLAITSENVPCKFFVGCTEILPGSCNPWPKTATFVRTTVSLAGGKGGFGSMLRAIGAQIEKTTNREACRDLSGRRLRDINEEKRLKDWVAKQADREREQEERKKKKLEKLKEEYHPPEFHDPEYFKARAEVTDKVHEALEQGIKACSSAAAEPVQKKRKATEDGPAMKKTALWLGVSDDELDSEDEATTSADNEQKSEAQSSDAEATSEQTSDEQAKPTESNTPVALEDSRIEPSACHTQSPKKEVSVLTEESSSSSSMTSSAAPEQSLPSTSSSTSDTKKASTATTPSEPIEFLPVDLDDFDSPQSLENLGLNHLKNELQRRGLKCGGSLPERAARLFSIKGLSQDQIDPALLAKPAKKK